jgi:hypothetical protein
MPLDATTTCTGDASGSTCITLYEANPSSTTADVNGFTYGEVVLIVNSFLTLMVVSVIAFHLMFRRTKIKN